MNNRINENIKNKDVLAEIINLSVDAIISLDENHKIVLVNAAVEKIFGYTEKEILGQSINILLPISLHKLHNKHIQSYGNSAEKSRQMGQQVVLYGISKSGDEIPFDISIQKHPEGSFCSYTAICRDISYQHGQDELVRENEAKFRMLFNSSHHLTILMDGEGNVLEFNDTAKSLLQIKPEKHIGRKVWDCEFWDSETDFSLVEDAISKITPSEDVSLIVSAIGEYNQKIALDISIKVTRSNNNQSTMIILEGKDVTEIRRSNKALVASEARLARAQSTASLGSFEWNISSNVSIWSEEIYNIFGLSPDTYKPDYETFIEKIHPDDRENVDNSIMQALKSCNTYDYVHRIIMPDGSEKTVEVFGQVSRTADGTPIRMEGTVQDVTVSWNREQELELAKISAEEANIAKAQFLSTVSHELKTPLNAIIGFGAMIAEEKLGEINNPTYRDYGMHINNSGKELLTLIDDILNVTRYELGAVKYKPRFVTAQYLLEGVLPNMSSRAAEKNINIETSIGSDLPELYIDLEHTQQILIHLIDNAIKFSKEDNIVNVNLYYEDDKFVIDVIDQGIGLEGADKEAIFDLFVQRDMRLNRIYNGVGLGLTIVKNLVEIQGARISVESCKEKGSCFSVCFPNICEDAALVVV